MECDSVYLTNVNGTLYFTGSRRVLAIMCINTPQALPPNQPPVAGNFSLNAAQGGVALVDGWNFTDPEGDQAQSIKITALPSHGTLFRDADSDNVIDTGEAVALDQMIPGPRPRRPTWSSTSRRAAISGLTRSSMW